MLNRADLEQIREALPLRMRETRWTLLFSAVPDGMSLTTMLATQQRAEDSPGGLGGIVLLLCDSHGQVAGAFSACRIGPGGPTEGSGESFLFRLARHSFGSGDPAREGAPAEGSDAAGKGAATPPPPPPRATGDEGFKAFHATGKNGAYVDWADGKLSFGLGGGNIGLQIDDELQCGHSGPCTTYDNTPLLPDTKRTGADAEDFLVVNVELWCIPKLAFA
jgi:hypothetical protein